MVENTVLLPRGIVTDVIVHISTEGTYKSNIKKSMANLFSFRLRE